MRRSTLVQRQAAQFGRGAAAADVTAILPNLAKRQLASIAKNKPPAHDQPISPRQQRLGLARNAAAPKGQRVM